MHECFRCIYGPERQGTVHTCLIEIFFFGTIKSNVFFKILFCLSFFSVGKNIKRETENDLRKKENPRKKAVMFSVSTSHKNSA